MPAGAALEGGNTIFTNLMVVLQAIHKLMFFNVFLSSAMRHSGFAAGPATAE
jgi:hypothetical protein